MSDRADPRTHSEGSVADFLSEYRRRAATARHRVHRATASTVLMALDVTMLVLAAAGVHGPVRLVVGLAFAVTVPGWSIVGLVRIHDAALEVALTIAVSLASLMVAAQLLITVGAWDLTTFQIVVCALCLPSLLWQALDRRRVAGEGA